MNPSIKPKINILKRIWDAVNYESDLKATVKLLKTDIESTPNDTELGKLIRKKYGK